MRMGSLPSSSRGHLPTEKSSGDKCTQRAGISIPEELTYLENDRPVHLEKMISTPIGRAISAIASSPEPTRTDHAMSTKAK